MGLGERIVCAIQNRRDKRQKSAEGPTGDYYRNGGDELLYDVPVNTGGLVLDAGGYHGDWTAKMVVRYGCRSEIFEPIPTYADHCQKLFERNSLVRVHAAALGGSSRETYFSLLADGTSEFSSKTHDDQVKASVLDISKFLKSLNSKNLDCLKLNIEGGEYEVLERLIDTGDISRINCLLVQFHPQPSSWNERLEAIVAALRETHNRDWHFPMVWEKWTLK